MRSRSPTVAALAAVATVAAVVLLGGRREGNDIGRSAVIVPAASVRTAAAPAAGQELGSNESAGTSAASEVHTEPHLLSALGLREEPVVSPAWSSEMEARILNHVSLYAGVALTNLEAQCVEAQCMVLMRAASAIDAFQYDFDEFARANGFESAVIGTADGDARIRIVTLRRAPEPLR